MADGETPGMTRMVVVGAGLVGLATAYFARQRGADVLVLDRRQVGSGASLGNAGWLAPSLSAPLPAPGLPRAALASMLSGDGAFRLAWRGALGYLPWLRHFRKFCTDSAHQRGFEAMAELADGCLDAYDEMAADGVSFQMARTGLLYVARTKQKAAATREALRPLAGVGVQPSEILTGDDLATLEPALTTDLSGFRVVTDRSVDPASVLHGLAARLDEMGVPIRTDDPVRGFHIDDGRISAVVTRTTRHRADVVVLAAGAHTGRLAGRCGLRLPIRSGTGHSFSVAPPTTPAQPLYLLEAKVAITPMPGRVRVTGGFDLTSPNPETKPRRVRAIASSASHYATWAGGPRRDEWAGSRPILPDGLPAIGPVPAIESMYINSGHAMLGVTLAPASGKLLADSILGTPGEPTPPAFSPARFDPGQRTRPSPGRWLSV